MRDLSDALPTNSGSHVAAPEGFNMTKDRQVAPRFPVPNVAIVSIEHPCIVENVEKAVAMLGGDEEIAQSLKPGNDKPLALRFQPADPASRAVVSYNNRTNNLLLKVTVPRRTGRGRKLGSNDDFIHAPADMRVRKDVRHLLRAMKDNPQRYQAEVVGSIHSTHVWRTMPDFVYSTKGSAYLDEVKTKILSQDYPRLKEWSLPGAPASASADTEAIPPPVFSTLALPYNFTYRPTISVKRALRNHTHREKKTVTELAPDENDRNHDTSGPDESLFENHAFLESPEPPDEPED